MKVVYHGTTKKAAEKISKQGLDSHSWVTSSPERALEFAKIKAFGKHDKFEGVTIVLKFIIPDDEFNLRAMPISKTDEEEVYRLTNYVYGKGWHKRLFPSGTVDTTSIYSNRRKRN